MSGIPRARRKKARVYGGVEDALKSAGCGALRVTVHIALGHATAYRATETMLVDYAKVLGSSNKEVHVVLGGDGAVYLRESSTRIADYNSQGDASGGKLTLVKMTSSSRGS